MLDKETLWEAASRSHTLLKERGLPHAIVGGVAVCLHGYQRNTVDVDLLVRPEDADDVRRVLSGAGWKWDSRQKQFVSDCGVILQFLLGGEKAGRDSEVCFPDPADPSAVTELEGLPVLTLARLIETKLASGAGDARRMYRDFADVVELIARHSLPKSFCRKLHASLRPTFLDLLARARAE